MTDVMKSPAALQPLQGTSDRGGESDVTNAPEAGKQGKSEVDPATRQPGAASSRSRHRSAPELLADGQDRLALTAGSGRLRGVPRRDVPVEDRGARRGGAALRLLACTGSAMGRSRADEPR